MERLQTLSQSSVGKKILMAATGVVLVAFVIPSTGLGGQVSGASGADAYKKAYAAKVGNKQAAARLLGLKRTTLVAKLRRRRGTAADDQDLDEQDEAPE